MRNTFFPLVLLALPLAEIAGFVIVGKWLGVFGTLGLIILSGLVGTLLLRVQGLGVLRQVQADSRLGRVPAETIGHGAMMVVGAILLIIPGFITDIVGLILFVPFIRRWIWKRMAQRIVVRSSFTQTSGANPSSTMREQVIDLEDNEYQRKPNPSSPWSSGPDPNDPKLGS
ncbi:membrane protein FxsA [Rhizobium lemnae]|uniref:FxsA family protein n=1 Tax=Rhizobium lemnae TaxID=1214924 RepID=A0ABV8E7F3_9HYPH|nr:FxsA family protein [Rhizobium lemnae]MCJ8508473.1 membrane protein FxsA [Rhizobium lemnae]